MRQARDVSKDSIHVRGTQVAGNIALPAKCLHPEYAHVMLMHGEDSVVFRENPRWLEARAPSLAISSRGLRNCRVLSALMAPPVDADWLCGTLVRWLARCGWDVILRCQSLSQTFETDVDPKPASRT